MIPERAPFGNTLPWIALGLLLAPLLLVSARIVVSGFPDLAVEGDLAMQDISTRGIREGRALLGPYSRFGFNHPGPAYFLLRLPVYCLSGCSSSSSYFTLPFLISSCLAGAFLLLRRFCGITVTTLCCLLLSLYLVMFPWTVWLKDWNPFAIIFPFLLCILACAAVGAGDHRWMPVAVIAGSLVAQTHLGGFPVVAAAALSTPLIRRWIGSAGCSAPGCRSRSLLLAAVIFIAVWLPVLVQEFAEGQGNIPRIVRFIGESSASVPLRVAAREWSGALTATEIILFFPRSLRAMGLLLEVTFALAVFRMAVMAACLLLLKRREGSGFVRSLAALVLVVHVAMFLGVLQVRGDLHDYLFSWYSVTSPLSWIVMALTAASLRTTPLKQSLAVRAILTCLILAPGVHLARATGVFHRGVFDPLAYSDQSVEALSASLEAFLALNPEQEWYLEPVPRDLWPVSAGIVNRLAGDGQPVHLDGYFGGLVGTGPPEGARRLLLVQADGCAPDMDETIGTHGSLVLGVDWNERQNSDR